MHVSKQHILTEPQIVLSNFDVDIYFDCIIVCIFCLTDILFEHNSMTMCVIIIISTLDLLKDLSKVCVKLEDDIFTDCTYIVCKFSCVSNFGTIYSIIFISRLGRLTDWNIMHVKYDKHILIACLNLFRAVPMTRFRPNSWQFIRLFAFWNWIFSITLWMCLWRLTRTSFIGSAVRWLCARLQ